LFTNGWIFYTVYNPDLRVLNLELNIQDRTDWIPPEFDLKVQVNDHSYRPAVAFMWLHSPQDFATQPLEADDDVDHIGSPADD